MFVVFSGYLVYLLFPDFYWINESFHSAIESMGALCAFILTVLILQIKKSSKVKPSYTFIVCGLISMGLLDMFHAVIHHGESFVWLHSIATLFGGLFFFMVWFSERFSESQLSHRLPATVFILSLFIGIVSLVSPEIMPTMLEEQTFTKTAYATNLTGGVLFIISSFWFFKGFIQDNAIDDLLFAFHCFLFGIAGILFVFSELWKIEWWLWHFIRMLAYSLLLFYIFNIYKVLSDKTLQEKNKAQKYLDVAASIIVVLDTNQNTSLINRKGCETLEYEEEDIVGRQWFDAFVPGSSRETAKKGFREMIAGNGDFEMNSEFPVLTHTKEERVIAWHNTLLRDDTGNVNGLLMAGADVTDQKKAKEELQVERDRLEIRVKERTAELESAIRLLEDEIKDRLKAEDELKKAKEEIEAWNKELEKRVEEQTDDLRRSQEQLIQSEKLSAMGQMAGGLAHELNSPLAGLIPMLEKFRREVEPHSQSYHELTLMLKACDHMAKIVRDFGSFSRESQNEFTPLNLNDVINDTLSFIASKVKQKSIRINTGFNQHLPQIMGERTEIQQVILNMLTNALDAMSNGGTLTISTDVSADGKGVFMQFEDDGSGISQENLSKIFDPFYTTKSPGKGTGLGLSVSYKIIEKHGGKISAASGSGKGSVFKIDLPLTVL